MGRVIFMCGPAGSGKSTVARQLEQQGMTRLSFGQEARSRAITAMPLPEDVHRGIGRVLRARLADLVRAGSGVVLGLLVLVPSHAGRIPAVPEAIWRRSGNGVPGDRPTVLRRIAARAAGDGDDFKISIELAAFYFDDFEVPSAAEGPLTVIR